jgi:hypothetical protein
MLTIISLPVLLRLVALEFACLNTATTVVLQIDMRNVSRPVRSSRISAEGKEL